MQVINSDVTTLIRHSKYRVQNDFNFINENKEIYLFNEVQRLQIHDGFDVNFNDYTT